MSGLAGRQAREQPGMESGTGASHRQAGGGALLPGRSSGSLQAVCEMPRPTGLQGLCSKGLLSLPRPPPPRLPARPAHPAHLKAATQATLVAAAPRLLQAAMSTRWGS